MSAILREKNLLKGLITSIFLGASTAATFTAIPEPALAQASGRFSSILVAGNQAIPDETVISFSGLQPGTSISADDINEALRRLYASGLFASVDIRAAAGRLVIAVVENPTIGIVNFEGNRDLSDSDLAAIVSSQARHPLNTATIEADARRITNAYLARSQYAAEVTPTIINLPDGRANLVFQVSEGRTDHIESINIVGNRHYTDRRLRRAMGGAESGFLNILYNSDNFNAEAANADRQALENFYRERGFPDVVVTSGVSEFALDRNGFFLTYTVQEGGRFDFGQASVTTEIEGLDAQSFAREFRIRSGHRYQASKVNDAVDAIELEAARRGMPFLRAVPRLIKNEADGTVDVEFQLVNSRRIYVERIDIRGNSETLDRVIRREFDMAEGDAFNARKMREAEAAIRALRFFSGMSVSVRQGSSPDKAIIEVDVQDASTGQFSFGAAYSTDNGFSGTFSVKERNFLGRGQRFDLSINYGEKNKVISFGFTEPHLFDRDLSAGFDIYFRRSDRPESSFQTTDYGFNVDLGFPLSDRTSMTLGYELVSEKIRDTTADTSPIIVADLGTELRSAVSFGLVYDHRDNPIQTANGYILRFGASYAGLGGSTNYVKATGRAKGYIGLFDDAVILTADIEGGALFSLDGDPSRITDRFFLGGTSFRGFAVGGLGPRDNDGLNVNDSLGGNYFAVARLDASFPIGLPRDLGIRGGIFVDAGSVWGMDGSPVGASGAIDTSMQLRASAGVALYWDTPLGPLVFNWANPFLKVTGDETQTFTVSVQTSF